jgi:uncharacterized protein (TIGR00255 family)
MRSMTGYGQASWHGGGRRLTVEVRAVNQRFLDVRVTLPRDCQRWEDELRALVQQHVERGKVDVSVNRTGSAPGAFDVEVNEALARATIEGWQRLQRRLRLPGTIDVGFLLGRGEFVRVVERRDLGPTDLPRVRALLVAALRRFNRERAREGRALARDMRGRTARLRRIAGVLRQRARALKPEFARRLAERMQTLLADAAVDRDRLLHEAALLAERADVTEELVRLDSHLGRLAELLRQDAAVGKPIDFLLQELHREINTIASKSNALAVTDLTLEARAEIEKLREQAQNVE